MDYIIIIQIFRSTKRAPNLFKKPPNGPLGTLSGGVNVVYQMRKVSNIFSITSHL